jgi:hypothetical protein
MKPSRPSWIVRIVVLAALGAGCIDATTVYTVPPPPPPDMTAAGDDGGGDGGAGDDGPPSDGLSITE